MPLSPTKPSDDLAPAEQVRALRDQLGWTHEELAEAVGASPLEVSAWEAGVVPMDAERRAALAREQVLAQRRQALANAAVEPCPWAAGMGPAALHVSGIRLSGAVQARMKRHRRHCPACQRVAEVEAAFPLPEPPRAEGALGWYLWVMTAGDRLLPRPFSTVVSTLMNLAVGLLALGVFGWITNPSGGFHLPVQQMVMALAGWWSYRLAATPLDGWYEDHPYLAGLLKSGAGLSVAGLVGAWLQGWDATSPVLWGGVAVLSCVAGYLLGLAEEDARDLEHLVLGSGPASTEPSPQVLEAWRRSAGKPALMQGE